MSATQHPALPRLLIAAATASEAQLAPRGLHITLVRTGMGADRARSQVRPALAGSSGILSFGFAGGLSNEAGSGRVLLPARIIDESGRSFPGAEAWHRRTLALLAALQPATGALLSIRSVAASAESKAALRQRFPAVAVDMESAALAGLAAEAGIPFLALRVVLDGPDDAIPPAASAAVAPDGTLRVGRLLRELLVRPAVLPSLLHLMTQHHRAARHLTEAAQRALPALLRPHG